MFHQYYTDFTAKVSTQSILQSNHILKCHVKQCGEYLFFPSCEITVAIKTFRPSHDKNEFLNYSIMLFNINSNICPQVK